MKTSRLCLFFAVILTFTLLSACGGGGGEGELPYSPDQIASGETLYNQTCFTCHGPDGKGLPNLGKDLTTSEYFAATADEELLVYVLEGREIDDPLNTTGIAMPPKGGFDFLTDQDILDTIAFIRTLQE